VKLELVLDEVELPWRPDPEWGVLAERMMSSLGPSNAVLQAVLTDDATLREHNREFRGMDEPTDVLSFSYLEDHEPHRRRLLEGVVGAEDFCTDPQPEVDALLAGQILISLETLSRRGPVHATNLDDELSFMLVHGTLHVLGYDHRDEHGTEEMETIETEIMDHWYKGWR